jgi:nicotinamidase/pyrazinamidase
VPRDPRRRGRRRRPGPRPARYSGFEDTPLESVLREHDIEGVTLVGLATDYCVRATALDALALGLRVEVDRAGVRAIDSDPGDGERALGEVSAAGGVVR